MFDPEVIQPLQEQLSSAQTVLVMCPGQATAEQLAAAGALYVSLLASGKHVQLLSPLPPRLSDEQRADLVGVDQVVTQLGNKDLHISFPYSAEKVDKVSYHIDEEQHQFHLVIKPQPGQRPLETSAIEMSYAGAEADLIITVGVSHLEQLEHLYTGFEELYQGTFVLSLHTSEPGFGSFKFTADHRSGVAELVADVLMTFNLPLSTDVATNLVAGIEEATDSFRSMGATAETFEVVAQLMRAGARRVRRRWVAPTLGGNGLAKSDTAGSDGESKALFSKALSKPKKGKDIKDEEETQPGDLHFQPTGFGPGGGG